MKVLNLFLKVLKSDIISNSSNYTCPVFTWCQSSTEITWKNICVAIHISFVHYVVYIIYFGRNWGFLYYLHIRE